ncbi:uncharacterized protein BDR25DRAFT_341803 [Lindgomyces ingoldianus]|uniref:Uncharacterized protein n=1 Tax=Lindgomyces ingoldianus TaxID=673940 RepID=A0ACB6QZK0_9PLEO|nr:uncharacterized protein BDR25DRAFT_341803 [Lindgomyces ingoldianus]KAF2472351.1 hypothetical protein BDR25DRAFT_341803 [Lindgomyces ingoldianus]
MSLKDDLTTETSDQVRGKIIHVLWNRKSTVNLQQNELDWDAYFAYYARECRQALLISQGRYISARTHEDITSTARLIEELNTKDAIKTVLRAKLTKVWPKEQEDEMLEGSIRLAARLLVMLDIGPFPKAFSGRPFLVWDEKSLKDCAQGYFNASSLRDHGDLKLEPLFTARNLCRIGGIEIAWTDNLADHLHFIEGDRKVRIFHHASFLKWQQSQILPKGLAEETLNTLALLFPQSEVETEKWFESMVRSNSDSIHLDRQLVRCGQLRTERRQFADFNFWHDRLVILKQVFDKSRPATMSQWWHDRRNGVQWYTFWVAILVLFLTIFFGLIQSIEGAMQTRTPTSRP